MSKKAKTRLAVVGVAAIVVFLLVSFGFMLPGHKQTAGRASDGKYYYSQYNCDWEYTPGKGSRLLSLPWSLPWSRTSAQTTEGYTLGERSFTVDEEGRQLLEAGESVIPDGTHIYSSSVKSTQYSLIAELYDERSSVGYYCATTEYSLVLDETLKPLCAAGRWAYAVDEVGDRATLYCVDLESGESWVIAEELDVSLAATDGQWLYIYRMWGSGYTSCWELALDASGRPSALTYVEEV